MLTKDTVSMRSISAVRATIASILLLCASNALQGAQIPEKILKNNTWELITFPNPSLAASFADILGDDIDLSTYGINWRILSYNAASREYEIPSLSQSPALGAAYWIWQATGTDVTIDVPANIQQESPYTWQGACQAGVSPCLPIELVSTPGEFNWQLAGSPHVGELAIDDVEIVSGNVNQACFSGCQIDTALNENVVYNVIFTFDGASNQYKQKMSGDFLSTWEGFWILSLPDAIQPELHLPEKPLAYFNEESLTATFLLPGDTDQLQQLTSTQIAHVSNGVYDNFNDNFDFLFMMVNNSEKPVSISAFGRHYSARNNTEGLGLSIYDSTTFYGSSGRLLGINAFPYRRGLVNGPGLHEIMHTWGNFLFRTTIRSHWGFTGFSGGKGQLGGFDSNTLSSLGNNTYSVESFGEIANGGNSLPYTPAELYLMGLIDSASVGDITVVSNPAITGNQDGKLTFTADSVSTSSFVDFLTDSGIPPRRPAQATSNAYTSLTVLMTAVVPTEEEIEETAEQARVFTAIGDDGSRLFNFNEATGFRATLSAEKPVDHVLR